MGYEYDVVLSFAGEDRQYVDKIAAYLRKKGIKFFYDKYEEVELWGKDLFVHLDEVYRKKGRYCVMFLSKNYATKAWANHERESAQARAFKDNEEYILPARFDDTEIPGIIPTTGYMDLRNKIPEEFAALIIRKIQKDGRSEGAKGNEAFRLPKAEPQAFNPYDEAQKFISFLTTELKKRCDALSIRRVSLSVFVRDGRTCLRCVSGGKTKYSLDVWLGGFSGDSSLSFHGVEGEPSFSSGSMNAWGDIVWDRERELLVMELQDMSLIGICSDKRRYTREEFVDALWDKICDSLESEI